MKKNHLPSVIAAVALTMIVSPAEAQVPVHSIPTPESMIEHLPQPEKQKAAEILNRMRPQQRAMHNTQSSEFTHYLSAIKDSYGGTTRYEYNEAGLRTHEAYYRYYYSDKDYHINNERIYEYDANGKQISNNTTVQ